MKTQSALRNVSLAGLSRLLSRKLHSLLAVRLFKLQRHFPRSFLPAPVQVVVEPTNRCNLNCQMCGRRYWDAEANPLGDMSLEFFSERVLPHLKPFQTVNLQCFGEPLINESFLAMLKACKAVGCYTGFTTNGVLLKQHAEAVVSAGADEVTVSIDGVRSVREIRKIGVERLMEAIDAVSEAKRRQGRNAPLIGVNCVLTRDVLRELPQLLDLCGVHGVSRMTVIHLGMHDLSLVEKSVLPMYEEADRYFEEARAVARRRGIHLLLPPRPGERFRCEQPFRTVVINWNGDVRPCCDSVVNEPDALRVGNLADRTLPELWNSAYMHRLRKALVEERALPRLCECCPSRICSLESHIHLFHAAE